MTDVNDRYGNVKLAIVSTTAIAKAMFAATSF
jgi:hypothetical protein